MVDLAPQYTSKWKIQVDTSTYWYGPTERKRFHVKNSSRGYHGLLIEWMRRLEIEGRVHFVGEKEQCVIDDFRKEFPAITRATKSDIEWDIVKSCKFPDAFDYVICQAVLEHVVDPVSALKNMLLSLRIGGKLIVYVPACGCAIHRYPIDCYRFMPDMPESLAKHLNVDLLDMYWSHRHVFFIYRRRI